MKNLFLTVLFLAQGSFALVPDDADRILTQLEAQLKLIENRKESKGILYHVKQHKKPHLYSVAFAIKKAKETINEVKKENEELPEEDQAIISLDIRVRQALRVYTLLADNDRYFDSVCTDNCSPMIEKFKAGVNRFKKSFGPIGSPLDKFASETYGQVWDLIKELNDNSHFKNIDLLGIEASVDPANTDEKTKDLRLSIGQHLFNVATTKKGHNSKSMGLRAESLAKDIREHIYPLFEKEVILADQEAFEIAIEIRTLNEYFYAEYVDVEDEDLVGDEK